jgi:type II secretory pathway component GspD/PulD (secretin)
MFIIGIYSQKVSFKAENAPMSMVLKSICKQHDLNLVMGSSVVDKRITIDLDKVSLDIALDMIAKASGVAYDRQDNTILVDSPQHLKNVVSKNFELIKLNYLDVEDLKETLSGFKDVDISTNESENSIAIFAPVNQLSKMKEIINKLDVPPKQVMIEVKLIEITTDKLDSLGINWDQLNTMTFAFAEGAAGTSSDADALPDNMGYVDMGEFPSLSRQLKGFRLILDLILENGYGNILSNTKLIAMNNHEASIHVGDIIPYVVRTYDQGETRERVEKEKVGIKLNIVPQISDSNKITVKVQPEVSNIHGWKGQNSDIPWVKTRKAETFVTVDNGKPIFIAGLRNEEETYNKKGIFPLSKIPLIKHLFTYTKKTTKQTDLIIQITPYIVGTDAMKEASNIDFNELRKKLKDNVKPKK